jgi:hypothetical protein
MLPSNPMRSLQHHQVVVLVMVPGEARRSKPLEP